MAHHPAAVLRPTFVLLAVCKASVTPVLFSWERHANQHAFAASKQDDTRASLPAAATTGARGHPQTLAPPSLAGGMVHSWRFEKDRSPPGRRLQVEEGSGEADFAGFASPPPPPLQPAPSLSSAWKIHLSIALPIVAGFVLTIGAYLLRRKLLATRSLCSWICFATPSSLASSLARSRTVASTTATSGQGTELPDRAIVVGTKVDGSATELGSVAEVAMISGRVVGSGAFTSALATLP